MKLPPGFTPIVFRDLLKIIGDVSPMIGPMLWKHLGLSEDEALERIKALEKKGLVQFAFSPANEPSVFAAADNLFQTAEEEILASLLVDFWDTTGQFNSKNGRILSATNNLIESSVVRVETPEGPLAIVAAIAKKMLHLGLLQIDAEGRYSGPSKQQVTRWTQEHGICDFCSDANPKHVEMVPDFSLEDAGIPGQVVDMMTEAWSPSQSIGGWATCDTCHTMIVENRRTDLLQRAITASRGGKFTAAALKGLHKRFWTALETKVEAASISAGLLDFIENRAPVVETDPKLKQRSVRQEAIRRLTGLTQDEMEALGKGDVMYKDVAKKLAAWRKRWGGDTLEDKRVALMLERVEHPLPSHLSPHWQQALDRKVEAIEKLGKGAGEISFVLEKDGPQLLDTPMARLMLDMGEDLIALKGAEIYSFNADTMHAIQIAAAKIPHEAPLKSIEVPPFRAGWFWFSEPFPVASAPLTSDRTHALLWTWDTKFKEPTLRFSAFVVDEKSPFGSPRRGTIAPSTKWFWPLSATFHEMIGLSHRFYDENYGPGTPDSIGKEWAIGKEPTMKVVAEMSLFFMQACQWFRDFVPGSPHKKKAPILTQEQGHIERHARKRYEKQFKATPNVRVIALRKTAPTVREEPTETVDPNDKSKRHLKVRFVVEGHHRLQRVGPGLKETKLIFIESYPKGPSDAPFKESGPRVFAVIR